MSFTNPLHEGRLILISLARDVFATLQVFETPGATGVLLEGAQPTIAYLSKEIGVGDEGDLYHLPFLFHENGLPWKEANAYFLSLMRDKAPSNRRTDDVRRRASKLLSYLIFCERNKLDWLDFSGARPPLRPTYKYFYYLINNNICSNAVINQYTSVIYYFYKYVSECWYALDIGRVDTVKQVRFIVYGSNGVRVIEAEKRSQTRRTPSMSTVPIGFVREDGEDLRPLSNSELGEFFKAISDENRWSVVERLILLTSLMTGARKQTVLTLRMKHLKAFQSDKILPDGTYKLHAGPGTGVDTKNDTAQILYFPKQLAEELITLAKCSMMRKRREKLNARLQVSHPEIEIHDDDMYLFLSDQGACYYMAKNDPRYSALRTPQTGQVTETIKRKLLDSTSRDFPRDFSYHWLRATFAYQMYQRLQVLVKEKMLRPGEDIDFIQKRMHHKSRVTTENYLKLFNMSHEKIFAQEIWEGVLFNGDYKVLNTGESIE